MAKYLSNRQKNLKIGVGTYTENNTVLEVTGKVGIGTTNAQSQLSVVGNGNFTGVVTASSFSGNASSADIASALTATASVNTTGIITASQLSIGTGGTGINITTNTMYFGNSSISIASTNINLISDNVLVATISSTGILFNVPIDMSNNKIIRLSIPTSLSDAANKDYVDNKVSGEFPTGDYGDLSLGDVDPFGQIISAFTAFDCSTIPSGALEIVDLMILD